MNKAIAEIQEGIIKMNPNWLFQFFIVVMVGVVGYFLDSSLRDIKTELEMSRVERAQIRADLTSFQIGTSGDRFTGSMWRDERALLEKDLDAIRKRLTELEANR